MKKLIKYDTKNNENIQENAAKSDNPFERLYQKSTISYNAKTLKTGFHATAKPKILTEIDVNRNKTHPVVSVAKEPKAKEVPIVRCESPDTPAAPIVIPAVVERHIKNDTDKPKMWIKPKSACSKRPFTAKANDPVTLYHAYQREWAKFKPQLPGENDHSELRWKIRTKLLGEH